MSNIRDRGLLDLAHTINACTNCGKWVHHGCEPAHQNGINAGKGFGIKSHDCYTAALCHQCHSWYDQGGGRDPSDRYGSGHKNDMWLAAFFRTLNEYWERNSFALSADARHAIRLSKAGVVS